MLNNLSSFNSGIFTTQSLWKEMGIHTGFSNHMLKILSHKPVWIDSKSIEIMQQQLMGSAMQTSLKLFDTVKYSLRGVSRPMYFLQELPIKQGNSALPSNFNSHLFGKNQGAFSGVLKIFHRKMLSLVKRVSIPAVLGLFVAAIALNMANTFEARSQTIDFSESTYTFGEDAPGGKVTIPLSISPAATQRSSVQYYTYSGTASVGEDFVRVPDFRLLVIFSGSTNTNIELDLIDDNNVESTESFKVRLLNPNGVSFASNAEFIEATINLEDDESNYTVKVSDLEVDEDTPSGRAILQVELIRPGSGQDEIKVEYSTVPETGIGKAIERTNYYSRSGELTFSGTNTRQTIEIPIKNIVQTITGALTFKVKLHNARNITTSSAARLQGGGNSLYVTVTILDTGASNTFTFENVESEVQESLGNLIIPVNFGTSNARLPGDFTVDYQIVSSSSRINSAYDSDISLVNENEPRPFDKTYTLSFQGNETIKNITIEIVDDLSYEHVESFIVKLLNPSSGAQFPQGVSSVSYVFSILDNDVRPYIAMDDVTVFEDVGIAKLDVRLVSSTDPTTEVTSYEEITIPYSTGTTGTATAGENFVAKTGSLTIERGQFSGLIEIEIIDNDADEPVGNDRKTFPVRLSTPTNADLPPGVSSVTSHVTIEDNEDLTELTLSFNNVSKDNTVRVFEDEELVEIEVKLSGSPSTDVEVHYATSELTARAGEDFIQISSTSQGETPTPLTFAKNATGDGLIKKITIPIINDGSNECLGLGCSQKSELAGEINNVDIFLLTLTSNATGVRFKGQPITGEDTLVETILIEIEDDDHPETPKIQFRTISKKVYEDSESVFVTISLTELPAQDVWVAYETLNGSATGGSGTAGDYEINTGTLKYSKADREVRKHITIQINQDTDHMENNGNDENFTIKLKKIRLPADKSEIRDEDPFREYRDVTDDTYRRIREYNNEVRLDRTTATVTIVEDDGKHKISFDDAVVSGPVDENAGYVEVGIKIEPPFADEFELKISAASIPYSSNTALPGEDFDTELYVHNQQPSTKNTIHTIAAGASTVKFRVPILSDADIEPEEYFKVRVEIPGSPNFREPNSVVAKYITINGETNMRNNNETEMTTIIKIPESIELSEELGGDGTDNNPGETDLILTLNRITHQTIKLQYYTFVNSLHNNPKYFQNVGLVDYSPIPESLKQSVTFSSGSKSTRVPLFIKNNDDPSSGVRKFTVFFDKRNVSGRASLSASGNNAIDQNILYTTVTIIDDDGDENVRLETEVVNNNLYEDSENLNVSFTISRDKVHTDDITINFRTESTKSAAAGEDYGTFGDTDETKGTITIVGSSTVADEEATFTIPILTDEESEADESFFVYLKLDNPPPMVRFTGGYEEISKRVIIKDDDSLPTLTISDVVVSEDIKHGIVYIPYVLDSTVNEALEFHYSTLSKTDQGSRTTLENHEFYHHDTSNPTLIADAAPWLIDSPDRYCGSIPWRTAAYRRRGSFPVRIRNDKDVEEADEILQIRVTNIRIRKLDVGSCSSNSSYPRLGEIRFQGGASSIVVNVRVQDDDKLPNNGELNHVFVAAQSTIITEGQAAEYTISATPPPTDRLEIDLQVSALGNYLFARLPTKAFINAGESTTTIRVQTLADNIAEEDGKLTVTITKVSGNYRVSNRTAAETRVLDAGNRTGPYYSVSESIITQILLSARSPGNPPTETIDQPIVNIAAVKESIDEGESAIFTVNITAVSNKETTVGIKLTQSGNFIFGDMIRSVVLSNGQTECALTVDTEDDNSAEPDGSITVTVMKGENYVIGSQGSATVTVFDYADRLQRNTDVSTAVKSVIPNLLASSTSNVFDAISERVLQAFKGNGTFSFELVGESSFTEMLKSGGVSLNADTLTLRSVLDDSSFAFSLFPEEGVANRTTLWGKGDLSERSSHAVDSSQYWDGDVFTGHLGLDSRIGESGLAGFVASMTESEIDYESGSDVQLNLNIDQVELRSYIGYDLPNEESNILLMSGYGVSDIDISEKNYSDTIIDSTFFSLGAKGSNRIYSSDSMVLGGRTTVDFKSAGWMSRQYLESNSNYFTDSTIKTMHYRISSEGSHVFNQTRWGKFKPSVSLGLRVDGMDRRISTGVEVISGLNFSTPVGLNASSSNSILLVDDSKVRKWGIHSSIRYNQNSNDLGLKLDISPSWGRSFDGTGIVFWDDDTVIGYNSATTTGFSEGGKFRTEIGYGIGMWHDTFVATPYGELSLSEDGNNVYSLGGLYKIGSDKEVKLEGTQNIESNGDTTHEIRFDGKLKW